MIGLRWHGGRPIVGDGDLFPCHMSPIRCWSAFDWKAVLLMLLLLFSLLLLRNVQFFLWFSEQPADRDGFTWGDKTSEVKPAEMHHYITQYGAHSIKRSVWVFICTAAVSEILLCSYNKSTISLIAWKARLQNDGFCYMQSTCLLWDSDSMIIKFRTPTPTLASKNLNSDSRTKIRLQLRL